MRNDLGFLLRRPRGPSGNLSRSEDREEVRADAPECRRRRPPTLRTFGASDRGLLWVFFPTRVSPCSSIPAVKGFPAGPLGSLAGPEKKEEVSR
jgi:hypothetical protein